MGRLARRFGGAVLLTPALIQPRLAKAETRESVKVEYSRSPGAESCPDEEELRNAISARLGYDPFDPLAKRRAVVRITRLPKALVAHLEMLDAGGKVVGVRDLSSPSSDCRELVASLGVAIAIGIDPVRGLTGAPAKEPENVAVSPVEPPQGTTNQGVKAEGPAGKPSDAADRSPHPGETESKSRPDSLLWRGGAGTVFGIGSTVAPSVGFTLLGGIRYRTVSLDIEGRADLATSLTLPAGGRVVTSLYLGSLVPCVHYGVFAGCAVGTLGALRARGESVTDPSRTTKAHVTAGGRLAFEFPIRPAISIRIHLDVLATITQITLQLDHRPVWTTPDASAGLGFAILGQI